MGTRSDTIAFFDDDPDIIEIYKRIFEFDGFNFVSASNPETALKLYKSMKDDPPRFTVVDVIFKSFSTDKPNGFGLCRQLREIDPGGIFIILTGLDDSLTRLRLIDSKADAIMEKPKTDIEILAKVAKIERERAEARAKPQTLRAPGQMGGSWFSNRELAVYAINLLFFLAISWCLGAIETHYRDQAAGISRIENSLKTDIVEIKHDIAEERDSRGTAFATVDSKIAKVQGTLDALKR